MKKNFIFFHFISAAQEDQLMSKKDILTRAELLNLFVVTLEISTLRAIFDKLKPEEQLDFFDAYLEEQGIDTLLALLQSYNSDIINLLPEIVDRLLSSYLIKL